MVRRNIPLWSQSGMIVIIVTTASKAGERGLMLYEIDPEKIIQLKSAGTAVTYRSAGQFSKLQVMQLKQ